MLVDVEITRPMRESAGVNNEPKQEDLEMEMNHSSSGEVPVNLKVAENPTFEVGSEAIIETAHMKGMKRAVATILVLMILRLTLFHIHR